LFATHDSIKFTLKTIALGNCSGAPETLLKSPIMLHSCHIPAAPIFPT
jgi:hypothetical protein